MAEKVVLQIDSEKFKFLGHVIDKHKDFLHKLGVADGIKKSLLEDTHTIQTIIETGKKEE